jgi:hypothetical protein
MVAHDKVWEKRKRAFDVNRTPSGVVLVYGLHVKLGWKTALRRL